MILGFSQFHRLSFDCSVVRASARRSPAIEDSPTVLIVTDLSKIGDQGTVARCVEQKFRLSCVIDEVEEGAADPVAADVDPLLLCWCNPAM